jgi:hypothetical protein
VWPWQGGWCVKGDAGVLLALVCVVCSCDALWGCGKTEVVGGEEGRSLILPLSPEAFREKRGGKTRVLVRYTSTTYTL